MLPDDAEDDHASWSCFTFLPGIHLHVPMPAAGGERGARAALGLELSGREGAVERVWMRLEFRSGLAGPRFRL